MTRRDPIAVTVVFILYTVMCGAAGYRYAANEFQAAAERARAESVAAILEQHTKQLAYDKEVLDGYRNSVADLTRRIGRGLAPRPPMPNPPAVPEGGTPGATGGADGPAAGVATAGELAALRAEFAAVAAACGTEVIKLKALQEWERKR